MSRLMRKQPLNPHQRRTPDGQFEQAVALAATASPILVPLQPYTNQPLIHVVGTAEPGARVTVYRTDKQNVKTVVGQVTADAQGSFAIDAQLTADGLYKFTAIALIGTQSSMESAPVLVTSIVSVPPPL